MIRQVFALERYDRTQGEAAGSPVPLLTTGDAVLLGTLRLPADEVVIALVEGPDAETVAAAATEAGWRVDRLSPALWIPGEIHVP